MADPEKKKRCLYEVLGLNPNCTADEIRSAYKRLALQLHPDKLIQSGAATPESATAAFQELVNAYEVLSDPRERVWYDSHRSQILFADVSSNGKGSSRSHDLDLFSYFSNSVYSGFTDRGKGFYKVYGDVFGKIYAREVDFAAKLGLGQDSVRPAPLMGNLECPYEQVTAFYGYWLGFCTVMDFSWVDEWDSAAGMNRRARRLMEDENAKVRKKARREYNEMVRDLAKFVKKRDKRVIEMLRRRKEEEEKRKAEEEKKKKEKEREKAERARLYEEPEWAKVDEDDGFDGLEEEEEEEERKDEEEFYCVVCGKKFKSDKQWRNHEQSKKHKERVEEFRRSAEAEDLEFGVEEEEVEALGDEVEKEEEKVGVDELCEEFENGVEISKEVNEAALDGDNEEKMSADEERSVLEAMLSGRRNRKKEASSRPSTSSAPGKDDEMEYNKTNPRKKGQKKKGRRSKNEEVKIEDSDPGKNENGVGSPEDVADDVQISSCDGDSGARISGEERNGTREQADWKGKGKKGAVTNMKNSSKGKKKKATTTSFVLSCETCGENFESRNKLFMHIGESGHAMLKAR